MTFLVGTGLVLVGVLAILAYVYAVKAYEQAETNDRRIGLHNVVFKALWSRLGEIEQDVLHIDNELTLMEDLREDDECPMCGGVLDEMIYSDDEPVYFCKDCDYSSESETCTR